MTKEQACEFVRIATMSREEIAKLNLPPVKWLTRADIDRLRDSAKSSVFAVVGQ